MGNEKHPKRRIKEPFMLLEKISLLYTPAFRSLTGSAWKLYCVLRAKPNKRLHELYSFEIEYAYSTLREDTGLSIGALSRSLRELENKGFIERIRKGWLKSGSGGNSIYQLSMRYKDYDNKEKFKPGIWKKEVKKKQNPATENRAIPLQKIDRAVSF